MSHGARFYGAVALGVLAVSVGVVLAGRKRELAHGGAAGVPADPGAIVAWCAEGLEPIPGGGCFAAPSGAPVGLLVYLHGRYAPETAAEELERQARVAKLAAPRGYGVLALRGMQGQCTDPSLATWWCWPSNEKNAGDGPAFVARWTSALAEAERRLGKTRRLLLGFSNGGYFASLIASRALVPFDAVVVAHAGPVAPMHPAGAAPPMLLIDADDDPSSPEILHLDADLTRESWPHAMIIREGGHALPEWDIQMSLTFFDRIRTERLPLVPPLSPPRPPHPHDAAPPDPDPFGDQAPSASASASPSASASASPSASASASPSAPAPAPPDPVLDPPP